MRLPTGCNYVEADKVTIELVENRIWNMKKLNVLKVQVENCF